MILKTYYKNANLLNAFKDYNIFSYNLLLSEN